MTTATPATTSTMEDTTLRVKVRPRKDDSMKQTKGMMSSLAICGGWGSGGGEGRKNRAEGYRTSTHRLRRQQEQLALGISSTKGKSCCIWHNLT